MESELVSMQWGEYNTGIIMIKMTTNKINYQASFKGMNIILLTQVHDLNVRDREKYLESVANIMLLENTCFRMKELPKALINEEYISYKK